MALEHVSPDDGGWDTARAAFNLAVDQRPAAVAFPETTADVVAALARARADGLRVAPQRTGHAAEALAPLLDRTLLLRTDRLRDLVPIGGDAAPAGENPAVAVDPAARSARVAAGALWGEVADAAAAHGLAPLAGSSRTVGVVGYHLGGGLSFAARRLGLAANAVRAVELVTAAGERVRASAGDQPDLFWALRGGGGAYGVVTALEIDLFELPDVYAGSLLYPLERCREVFRAWHAATLTAPDDLTLGVRALRVPDVPGPPPPLRGRAFAVVDAVFLGTEADGAELLAPLRALGPELDMVAPTGAEALSRVHMDPEDPVPALTDHRLVGQLPAAAVDAFADAVGPDSGCTLVSAELRQTGGALSRPAPGGGVLAALPGDYFGFGVGALMAPGARAAVRADLDRLQDVLRPHDAGCFLNFGERPGPLSRFHPPDVVERLREVEARWDPDDLIVAHHPVA